MQIKNPLNRFTKQKILEYLSNPTPWPKPINIHRDIYLTACPLCLLTARREEWLNLKNRHTFQSFLSISSSII
jgi:hypothetical protein